MSAIGGFCALLSCKVFICHGVLICICDGVVVFLFSFGFWICSWQLMFICICNGASIGVFHLRAGHLRSSRFVVAFAQGCSLCFHCSVAVRWVSTAAIDYRRANLFSKLSTIPITVSVGWVNCLVGRKSTRAGCRHSPCRFVELFWQGGILTSWMF